MSLSSARNYALRASKSQDQKEAIELLSKAILEPALSIETTDVKVKKIISFEDGHSCCHGTAGSLRLLWPGLRRSD